MCREKYDELVAKERDLNNFMDSFPSRRAEKTREAQEKQDAIVAVLDKIAKLQGLVGSALPTQKKFKEMQVRPPGSGLIAASFPLDGHRYKWYYGRISWGYDISSWFCLQDELEYKKMQLENTQVGVVDSSC